MSTARPAALPEPLRAPASAAANETPAAATAGSVRADTPTTGVAQPVHAPEPLAHARVVLMPPSYAAGYLHNPPPRYPLIARRNGDEGTVTVRVLVTREGRAGSVALERTSGFPALDAAALEAVQRWRFVPARRDGQPTDASVLVPIVFRLQDAG